tara:strand:- start:128 stop:436 length:309 start_codon:yes stop_codon:yes gene_type:complete
MFNNDSKFVRLWKGLRFIKKIRKWYKIFSTFAGAEENKIYAQAFDKLKAIIEDKENLEITEKTARNVAYVFANINSTEELAFVVMKYKQAIGEDAKDDNTAD